MDNILDSHINSGQMVINTEIKSYLKETAKWAKLFAIVGFVMMALIVVIGLTMGTFMARMMSSEAMPGANIGAGFFTVYFIAIAAIYFFPLYYLLKFANNMKQALASDDQEALAISFKNLKSCYKFIGILMVVVLCLYALIFVIAFIGGVAGGFMG